jgi:hypothetical protein
LLIASLQPYLWYFSFLALIPFLYRIIKATPSELLRLSILFGITFFTVSLTDSFPVSAVPSLLKLLLGTGLFGVFGWSIARVKIRWGFNPFLISVLWIFIQIGFMKLGFLGELIGKTGLTHPVQQGLAGLIGFLAVSVIIVLFNSILVLMIAKAIMLTIVKNKNFHKERRGWSLLLTCNLHNAKVHVVPGDRAPPFHLFLVFKTLVTDTFPSIGKVICPAS